MAKFARCSCAKTTAKCFNSLCHFHLISPVSRPQRPLIYDCIYFSFPNPPPPPPPPPPSPVTNISGGNFLGALFIPKVPLETCAPPPPPTFWCFLCPCWLHTPQSLYPHICHKIFVLFGIFCCLCTVHNWLFENRLIAKCVCQCWWQEFYVNVIKVSLSNFKFNPLFRNGDVDS
jgi:hypothetical protein